MIKKLKYSVKVLRYILIFSKSMYAFFRTIYYRTSDINTWVKNSLNKTLQSIVYILIFLRTCKKAM